jgi:dephospho-CoA kinase
MRLHTDKKNRIQPCVIGLTGGFGSGKSLALKIFRAQGISVLQTDKIGHEVLGNPGIIKVLVNKFGIEILVGRNRIDRMKLANKAFRNSHGQKTINKILHPLIRRYVEKWVVNQTKMNKHNTILIVEVPLLFETSYNRWFNRTICISASKSVRHKRLLKLGWTHEEIEKREKLQWPQNKKNQMADWVIFNTGSMRKLRYTIHRWLRKTAFKQVLQRPASDQNSAKLIKGSPWNVEY